MATNGWGGARLNAGRKRAGRRRVPHLARERFERAAPVHITLRMAPHVYNLRSRRCFSVLARAFSSAAERFGMRIVQFAVLGNHVHMVVEASSEHALARAMKGFSVRVARGLNRVMGRRGRVLGDRYHSRVMESPDDARCVVRYVRLNALRHGMATHPTHDAYASHTVDLALPAPQTWVLRAIGPP
jgi:REP element-mobilizing transposase RayT